MEHIDNLGWRKSSFSGNGGASCVEVAGHDGMILVRDTKDHGHGPVQRFTRAEWYAFVAGVRNGEFDLNADARLP
jgi:hypothetical protein